METIKKIISDNINIILLGGLIGITVGYIEYYYIWPAYKKNYDESKKEKN